MLSDLGDADFPFAMQASSIGWTFIKLAEQTLLLWSFDLWPSDFSALFLLDREAEQADIIKWSLRKCVYTVFHKTLCQS